VERPSVPSPYESSEAAGEAANVVEARVRLDHSISGFNRHARQAAQYRGAIERFERARDAFERTRAGTAQAHDAAQIAIQGAELERLRTARELTAYHRTAVERAVRLYVRSLKDEGMPPERVLVTVKHRLAHAVKADAPDAPRLEAIQLAEAVSGWTIAALFEGR
jgi:hypothetical protein